MPSSINWVPLKVPEEVRDEVRQIVQEQAPGGTTYGDCLLAGAKALAGERQADERVLPEEVASEAVEELAVEAAGPQVDDSEIAAAVVRQFDYAELSEQVARRVREELQG